MHLSNILRLKSKEIIVSKVFVNSVEMKLKKFHSAGTVPMVKTIMDADGSKDIVSKCRYDKGDLSLTLTVWNNRYMLMEMCDSIAVVRMFDSNNTCKVDPDFIITDVALDATGNYLCATAAFTTSDSNFMINSYRWYCNLPTVTTPTIYIDGYVKPETAQDIVDLVVKLSAINTEVRLDAVVKDISDKISIIAKDNLVLGVRFDTSSTLTLLIMDSQSGRWGEVVIDFPDINNIKSNVNYN